MGTSTTRKRSRSGASGSASVYPARSMFFATKASEFTISMPFGRRSSMFARSAAGLKATSTSG